MNLNYDNLVQSNSITGVRSVTNFIPWRPIDFFTNAADRLLANYGYNFTTANIQLWPTNQYTPSVHRLLQLVRLVAAHQVGIIHGDLNLENVLVGPGSLVWLIDFAQTREGHPLYDFAHLESELIAHVLAPRAGSPRTFLELWQSGADPLVNALHAIASRCLFDPARPREYHLALYMACLGALKYANLSALAKYCLYLTAADLSTGLASR